MKLIIFIFIFATALFLSFVPISLTFHVAAQSEVVDLEYCGAVIPEWYLDSAKIHFNDTSFVFSGLFQLSERGHFEISFKRIDRQELQVFVEPVRDTVGYLSNENGKLFVNGPKGLYITFPQSDRMNPIPIIGAVRIGRLPKFGKGSNIPMLKQGKIEMRAHPYFNKNIKLFQTAEIEPGDIFQLSDSVSCSKHPAQGFIWFNPGTDGLQVVADFRGNKTVVERYSGEGYTLQSPLFLRLKTDTTVQIIWALIMAVIGINKFIKSHHGHKKNF